MLKHILILMASILTLTACAGKNDPQIDPEPQGEPEPIPVVTTTINGATFPALRNGLISAYAFGSGARGAPLATGQTNQLGEYTLTDVPSDQLMLVCVVGDSDSTSIRYTEIASGRIVSLTAEDEVCVVDNLVGPDPHTMVISYYTHLSYARALYLIATGMSPGDAVGQGNLRVREILNFNAVTTLPVNIRDSNNATTEVSDAYLYSMALAAISQYTVAISESNQEDPVHQMYNTLSYTQTAFADVLYDGELNGQGESGVLNFGQVAINTDTYRHLIASNLFVFAASNSNYSGLDGVDLRAFGLRLNDSANDLFGGAPLVSLDTTAPIITNVSITNNQTVSQSLVISADVTDIFVLQSVEFSLDGGVLQTFNPAEPPFSYSLDTTQYAEGDHSIVIQATNQFNGVNTQSFTLTFNNEDTVVTNIQPSEGAHVRGSFSLTAAASDPLGVNQVDILMDGLFRSTVAIPTTPSVQIDSTTLTDAVHTFTFRVTNGLGFVTDHSVSYTVDNTLPTAQFNNVVADAILMGTEEILFSVSDANLSTAGLRLDGSVLSNYTQFTEPMPAYALDTTQYADATHTLALTATDQAGNNQITSLEVVIDNNPPSVAITSPANASVMTSNFTVLADISDAVGVTSVEYRLDSTVLASSAVNLSQYAEGDHTLTVTATDQAGHQGSDSVAVVFDTTVPTVTITNPTNASTQISDFTLSADVSDARGIAGVAYYADDILLASPDISIASYSDGNHVFRVQATDNSGLQNSDSVTVFIDNTEPSVEITNPLPGDNINGPFCIEANVSDLSGIQNVEFLIGDAHLAYPSNVTAPIQCFTSTDFANGQNIFAVKAWDNSGLVSTKSVSVNIVGN
ncbi:MAG: Ig-like domain-containing protein [Gammaproteobacteria bacterium]|nr:Ig-like domain-containing protein [Gammaproteobacteria bacterium]MDH5802677.1 Ig-like domain-containing protein [Gammaproteobacteria bacterium]